MKPSEVNQEYHLQDWSSMIQERQASGLSIKNWCAERGLSENTYYYRLRRLREAACTTLEKMQEATITELPLAPQKDSMAQIRITMKTGAVVEISNAGAGVLEQILRVLSHVE